MIDEAVKIHNKTQFEIKLEYKFNKNNQNAKYEVETYIFLPSSLGINRHTFRKVNFYDSIQNYIRFKTPVYTLSEIWNGKTSPFIRLKNSYQILAKAPNKQNFADYEFHNKIFVDILGSALRESAKNIMKSESVNEMQNMINSELSSIHKIQKEFRSLHKIVDIPKISNEYSTVFSFSDEFLSLLTERHLFKILNFLNEAKKSELNHLKEELLTFLRNETDYRIAQEYHSIPSVDSDNEEFLTRFNILKKYFASVLHIDTNQEKNTKWVEQFMFGMAAGLAMLFATTVAFLYQAVYGNLTIQLLFVLVLSYILKDRMKEMSKEFLSSRFLKDFYDYRIRLYTDEKVKIGKFFEDFDFVSNEEIPKRIFEIHYKYRAKEFYNKFSREKIIRYKTKTLLLPTEYKKAIKDYKSDAITNIFRFDVNRLLSKMDNPRIPISALTENGFATTIGKRVYNMNLVIKYISAEETTISHYRFILNRNGIKRLESVWTEIY